ncbi:MAG: zinc ribbon domain-containing protein [Phycisphaerales bacterium]|nr:zinc ribbon domain-containing protein [Phycisphaerales bacterium]MCB9862513.1 zinc ribbon domain-containing protein [Phycisphaerales bacterium]
MMSQQNDGRDRIHKIKLGVAVVLFIVAGALAARSLLQDSPADYANDRGFKCSECGHDYAYVIRSGDFEPLECPKCHQRSAYQAEMCFWTKGPDGQYVAKTEPTLVLLKSRIDPTSDEPTYCPDCGHEVVGHNPRPSEALMLEASGREGRD